MKLAHELFTDSLQLQLLLRIETGRIRKYRRTLQHTEMFLLLCHADLNRLVHPLFFDFKILQDIRKIRCTYFCSPGRCRRPAIADKVDDRKVHLMTNSGNDRRLQGIDRAGKLLIVERPKILDRSAAPDKKNDIIASGIDQL